MQEQLILFKKNNLLYKFKKSCPLMAQAQSIDDAPASKDSIAAFWKLVDPENNLETKSSASRPAKESVKSP